MKKIFLALFLAVFTLSTYSCRETAEEDPETVIDEVGTEVEDAGEELEETADEVGEDIEDAGDM